MKNIVLSALGTVVLGLVFAPAGHAQVVNGNFGTGDFTGWSVPTSTALDPYYTSVITAPSSDSTYAADMGAYYDTTLPVANHIQTYVSQTIPTIPGQGSTISFLYGEHNDNPSFGGDYYLDPGNITTSNDPDTNLWAQNNELDVTFGGTPVFSASNFFTSNAANVSPTNPDAGLTVGDYFYLTASFSAIASGTSTVLTFTGDDYQQSVILTDVSVPEPASLALLASAFAGLGFVRRRRG